MKRFIVLLLVCCLGAAVTARPIRGTVKCAGTPVSGVTVTDGHSFTESGADGTFTLDADDDALFISIVTPSGYLAPMEQDIPQFFRPYAASTKRYDFELRPWPATGEVYELLAIGDPQPKTAAHFDRLRTEIIPELRRATALGKQRGTAQAALLLGDIVWDSPELFAGVREQFASLGIPVYGVIGNHDHDRNKYTDREATENYRNHFGPTYYAFDRGIVHFDLANNYGPAYGTAEENFGRLMERSFRPYRDEMFIATKAGYDMWPGPYGNWGSRKYLMASLDQSLRRMKLDYADVFYSHRYDPETPLEETLQTLVDIVRSGKALYAGLSRYPLAAERFAFRYLAERDVPCLLFQDKYNIFNREPATSGVLSLAAESGTGFAAFSPLAQGLLTGRYLNGIPQDSRMAEGRSLRRDVLTDAMLARIRGLDDLARQRGQTLAEMALAWLLHDSRVTTVIIGASSTAQIADNLRALENTAFSDEELARIDALSRE